MTGVTPTSVLYATGVASLWQASFLCSPRAAHLVQSHSVVSSCSPGCVSEPLRHARFLSISCISHAGRVDSVEQARTKSRPHSVPLLKCLCVNVLAAHDHDIILFGVVVCSVSFLVCPKSTLQCLHSASTWCPFHSLTLPCTLNALCQKKRRRYPSCGKRRGRGGGARCIGMDE